MAQPLYCFQIDTEAGTINKIEISEFQMKPIPFNKASYYFYITNKKGRKIRKCIESNKLDRLSSGKFYTFDPDEEKARNEICSELMTRLKKSVTECNKIIATMKALGFSKEG